MRWLPFVLVTFLVVCPARAQDLSPTQREYELNTQALEYLEQQKYDLAAARLQEALELRELNILWLNLGRVYQRDGRCQEAIEAYTNALTAPAVADPPRAEVRDTATEYMNELLEDCPARVTVECEPETMTVSARRESDRLVVGAVECGATREWDGGTWTFIGVAEDEKQVTKKVEVRAARDYTVRLEVASKPVEQAEPDATEESVDAAAVAAASQARLKRARKTRNGIVFLSAGLVTMVTAAFFDGLLVPGFPPTSDNQRLDPFDWVPASLWLLGTGAATVGIVLFF